jgi:hypothetical protein
MADDDIDNIDFANYKGIYAEEESEEKYTCPVTGAHFEFNDFCKRLNKVLAFRKAMELKELKETAKTSQARQRQQAAQGIQRKAGENFSNTNFSITEDPTAK